MKRLMILLAVLLAWCIPACAEQQAEEALAVMLEAHPGYAVLACDQWSPTAAAVLGKGDERILCVAEKIKEEWRLTIDNPTALPAGAEVSLLVDTDTSLYWSIPDTSVDMEAVWHYSCFKEKSTWGLVHCIYMRTDGEIGLVETSLCYDDDALYKSVAYYDANENYISSEEGPVVPAAWLEEYLVLANYDAAIVPVPESWYEGRSWLNQDTLRRCLEELQPGYTFVSGAATDDGLEILARDPEGALRMMTCVCRDGIPITNISSVLPETAVYGYENFWENVCIPGQAAADLAPYPDGVWAVRYTVPDSAEGDILFFGRNWISTSAAVGRGAFYVGDHPWSDVSTMDWSALPASLEEAMEHLDPSHWAVVNNPDPADRLHLRYRADKDSRSLGKFYNGTPVEVLEKGETWTRVRVQGISGWMMTRYLAFGKEAWTVEEAIPDLFFVPGKEYFLVWNRERLYGDGAFPKDGDWSVEEDEDFCIIGVYGDEYYHVWFPYRNEAGLMLQSDFYPGNG